MANSDTLLPVEAAAAASAARPVAHTRAYGHRRWQSELARLWSDPFSLGVRIVLAVWTLIVLVPLVEVVSTSFSSSDSIGQFVALVLPSHLAPENYPEASAFMDKYVVPIWTLYWNTGVYTVGGLVLALSVAVLASYAFATMDFPGRSILFYTLLTGLVVPIVALVVPEFLVVKNLGLLNTMVGVILPYAAFSLALSMMILTTFFRELPRELLDAAAIDGASPFVTLWTIVLPLSKPALSACTILIFLRLWNEFALASVLVNQKALMNLQVGILAMFGSVYTPWHLVAAVLVLATLPVTLIFLLFQRQFVAGLSEGALKG